MSYSQNILRGIKLHGEVDPATVDEKADKLMRNADYLRQSSALINEALQKGFDVLQLANGDVVTTGTKIVVTQYSWDEEQGRLVKAKAGGGTRRGRPRKADKEKMRQMIEEESE